MPNVGDVRGLGLIAGVEVVADKASRASIPGAGPKLVCALRERGVITRAKGDSILFAPPLVTSEAQIDVIVNATAESIDEVALTAGLS